MSVSDFQSRSTAEGRTAQAIAETVVTGAGFVMLRRNEVHRLTGATINLVASDARDATWYFDVTGSFTSARAGLLRTDTV